MGISFAHFSVPLLKLLKPRRTYVDLRANLAFLHSERRSESLLLDKNLFNKAICDLLLQAAYASHHTGLIFIWEQGKSLYHKNISKTYKEGRRASLLKSSFAEGTELTPLQRKVKALVALLLELLPCLPNTRVITVNHLEGDFIPHFLEFLKPSKSFLIASPDKDLIQTLRFKGGIQSRKKSRNVNRFIRNPSLKPSPFDFYEVVNKRNAVCRFTATASGKCKEAKDEELTEVFVSFLAELLAVVGDTSDGIKGVKGLGFKTAIGLLGKIKGELLSIKETDPLKRGLMFYKLFTSLLRQKGLSPLTQEEFERNLKLVSFDVLINELGVNSIKEHLEYSASCGAPDDVRYVFSALPCANELFKALNL